MTAGRATGRHTTRTPGRPASTRSPAGVLGVARGFSTVSMILTRASMPSGRMSKARAGHASVEQPPLLAGAEQGEPRVVRTGLAGGLVAAVLGVDS
ncbi:hypothetical protein ACIHCM_03745 [Streptomyces sp. NPDC052023]|uniref:hypothetical protein n=1 Tax=Streptomyces sp. NPDC052023 TaxID=3365681 RepID=UPI0037D05F6A